MTNIVNGVFSLALQSLKMYKEKTETMVGNIKINGICYAFQKFELVCGYKSSSLLTNSHFWCSSLRICGGDD